MERISRIVVNVIFCIQVLLIFLLVVEDKVLLPAWLQVAGRMHPLVLHLPIGILIFLVVIVFFQKQLDSSFTNEIIHIGLLITSLSASIAALFGYFLSLQSDYGTAVLMRHKVSGVTLSFLCYAVLLWHRGGMKRSVFLGLGVVSFLILIIAGHTGAVLTHGENFLFAPISRSTEVLTAENSSVYKFAVEPILERKCFTCHNESKAKGKLIMTSEDQFKAGGEHGKPWVEGKPMESRMIKAFYLPISHDEHMPPDGKPQLTQLEIATLKAWIKAGADFEKKLNQFPDGDSLKFMVASLASLQPSVPEDPQYTFSAASDDVIKKMNTPFRSVFPFYEGSPALQADFFVKKYFEIKFLEELKAVKDQLVILNLSKMPLTDRDLSIIKAFKNLEQVNLNFSSINGSGLTELNSLKNLKTVSLSGTAVGVRDIAPLLSLPQLEEVYIWSTKVSASQADSLREKHPSLLIVDNQFEDDEKLKLSRPLLANDGVIKKNEEVVLKHPMPGVTIRYTLDGSEPDTANGQIYAHAFEFAETSVVKARACKDGWNCSDVLEVTCFVEGTKPKHIELLSPADPQYPGEGAQSLVDGRKGFSDVLKEPSWLGYREQPFIAGFDFEGDLPEVKKIVLSFGRNIGGHLFPPEEVEVWAGDDKNNLTMIKKMKIKQPTGYESQKVEALFIPLESSTHRYYKVVARPIAKLPQWHSGKGKKGWVFIDELFIY
jgi:uncharacterized membrane protein